jgi:DNA (cytosine-5)-methyltransferase 1
MRHLDLFSGIGGFAYAAQMIWGSQYENAGFCEIDPFCQNVLRKNFPEAEIYPDIRTIAHTDGSRSQGGDSAGEDGRSWITGHVDLVTGGFPCQPFSQAGRRRGTDDNRYLWPEMLRVIQDFQPSWVIAENVGGLVTWNNGLVFETVCTDLEAAGFEVQPFIIPAAAVGAPHRRDRVWFVARNTKYDGQHGTKDASSRHQGGHGNTQRTDKVRKPKRANSVWGHATNAAYSIVGGLGLQPQQDTQNTQPSVTGELAANSRRFRRESRRSNAIRPEEQEPVGSDSGRISWNRDWQEVASATCLPRVDDGLPRRVVRLPDGTVISEAQWRKEAIKAYGNAIVPQVAMQIMKSIKEAIIMEKLEAIDEHILTQLNYNEEFCMGYDYLENHLYKRPELKKAIKKLREQGYVEYWRGLMTEDGQVAGSGFCRTSKGNEYVEEHQL